ncbi:hypothetical protein AB6A40_007843 [Gnathostoma spinigerum]|uniref:Uncharacterized protein n=1 Tax=Gnathostoma spinigerum TaxID=75299 RepID=A0ABD6EMF1_9BILA
MTQKQRFRDNSSSQKESASDMNENNVKAFFKSFGEEIQEAFEASLLGQKKNSLKEEPQCSSRNRSSVKSKQKRIEQKKDDKLEEDKSSSTDKVPRKSGEFEKRDKERYRSTEERNSIDSERKGAIKKQRNKDSLSSYSKRKSTENRSVEQTRKRAVKPKKEKYYKSEDSCSVRSAGSVNSSAGRSKGRVGEKISTNSDSTEDSDLRNVRCAESTDEEHAEKIGLLENVKEKNAENERQSDYGKEHPSLLSKGTKIESSDVDHNDVIERGKVGERVEVGHAKGHSSDGRSAELNISFSSLDDGVKTEYKLDEKNTLTIYRQSAPSDEIVVYRLQNVDGRRIILEKTPQSALLMSTGVGGKCRRYIACQRVE